MAITPLPTPPSRNDPTNFSTRADAFMAALPAFATETNATAVEVDNDRIASAASASSAATQVGLAAAQVTLAEAAAASAVASANVTKWVSGTTYTEGAVVWSPSNYLTYRRKTTGGGTTDPSSDSTNWAQVAGTGDVTLIGTQTLTNKTLTDPNLTSPNITGGLELAGASGTVGQVPISQGSGQNPIWTTLQSGLVGSTPFTVNTKKDFAGMAVSLTSINATGCRKIQLDANREMIIVSGISGAYTIAAVYNQTTDTMGSLTLCQSSRTLFGALLIDTDKVLIVTINSTTSLQAQVLSVSGTTITVGTAVTRVLGSTRTNLNANYNYVSFIAVGSTYVLSYGRSGRTSILCFTVSGTSVTVGTETNIGTIVDNGAVLKTLSSSTFLAMHMSITETFAATVFSVSGVIITQTSQQTTPTATNSNWFYAGQFQSGQYAVIIDQVTTKAAIINIVGGTVQALSTATLFSSGFEFVNTAIYNIIGDKLLMYQGSSLFANVLTNTSGTASVGTEVGLIGGAVTINCVFGDGIYFTDRYAKRKLSINGANPQFSIMTGYKGDSQNEDQNYGQLSAKFWNSGDWQEFCVASATKKAMPNRFTYENSDGTTSSTVGISTGTPYIYGGNTLWSIEVFNNTNATLTKVTLS